MSDGQVCLELTDLRVAQSQLARSASALSHALRTGSKHGSASDEYVEMGCSDPFDTTAITYSGGRLPITFHRVSVRCRKKLFGCEPLVLGVGSSGEGSRADSAEPATGRCPHVATCAKRVQGSAANSSIVSSRTLNAFSCLSSSAYACRSGVEMIS